MAVAIDARGLAEDLEKAGCSPSQAPGMMRAIRAQAGATLATKTDRRALGPRLEARFAELETRT